MTDNPTATPVPQHLQSLLSHPFTTTEDALVTLFCLSPPPSLRPASQLLVVDWRLSKLVAEGRPLDALRFAHQAHAKGLPTTDDRASLLRAVRDTLSEVQRSEIDLEGDIPAPGPSKPALVNGAGGAPSTSQSNVAHPAWQPQPARPATPAPRSLAEVARAKETVPAPQQVDLPLSASPFLRRDAPLVGTKDGGALGGAQKSVLRALREGTQEATGSPKGKGKAAPESPRSVFGADSPRRFVSIGSEIGAGSPRASTVGLDGLEVVTPRKPTLSGFGSVRQPASAAYRMAELEDDEMSDEDEAEHELKLASPPAARPLPARITSNHADRPAPDSPFAFRATQDPAIASTLAAATPAKPTRTPRSEVKRRPSASRDAKAAGVPDEKRRAISVEPEDRPVARVPVAASSSAGGGGLRRSKTMQALPPGGFPGLVDDDVAEQDEEEEGTQMDVQEEQPREKRTRAKTAPGRVKATASATATPAKTPVRRSARASSVQPEDRNGNGGEAGAAATPRPRTRLAKSLSQQSLAPETPRTRMSTRKSSRLLGTPAVAEREEDGEGLGEGEEGRTPARGRAKRK